jgi:hypothetical protein
MERLAFKRPRQHFDTATHPTHVTFNDGTTQRNLPWAHYNEAIRDGAEPDLIRVEIGDWIVLLRGYNLGPLFVAIEEHTLLRVRAQPELAQNGERDSDSFVTTIHFTRSLTLGMPSKRKNSPQMELGIG